jgi:prepilin-type N-terminal cleavage/methylation domain-containing protein
MNSLWTRKKPKYLTGFTIVEILVVTAIIAILAAASAPFYSRFILQNATQNTSNQLVGMLREAEIYSISGKDASDWGVSFTSGKLSLFRASDNTIYAEFVLNPNVQITGFSQVIFSRPAGLPNTSGTFTISGGNNTATIDLNTQGIVSVH